MTKSTLSSKNSRSGTQYFIEGFHLATRPGIRRFVILPLLANIIFLGGAFWWLFSQLNNWVNWVMEKIPSWLQWLDYLIWPLAVITILLLFTYLFSTLANIIAAPFNGWLSEVLESQLTGKPAPDSGITGLIKDIPRILKRELVKLAYYLPRAILLLLLYFIPVFGQTVAPVLWFVFSAWMLAIQYCDYPFDNRKVSFNDMKLSLRRNKMDNLQFGAWVSVLTMIPIVNLFIMPVAVCGATSMWVDKYRSHYVHD